MTKVTFVRHGQSMWNNSNRIQGSSPHVPLSPKGRLEAMRVSEYFAQNNIGFDRAFSSSARRALETAFYALKHDKELSARILRSDSLHELRQGSWEGQILHPDHEFRRWRKDVDRYLNDVAPGGESVKQLSERMRGWFNDSVDERSGENLIVFGHGLAIRTLLWSLGLIDKQQVRHASLSNTSLTTIRFDDDWQLLSYNKTPHF